LKDKYVELVRKIKWRVFNSLINTLKNIWEDPVVVTNRTIDVHVRKVREKLGDDIIATVKGVGYKFAL